MRLSRPRARWSRLLGVAGATALVLSCDTTVGFQPNELLWGFVNISAQQTLGGELRTAPSGVFFRGAVSTIPDAGLKPDSCFPSQTFNPPGNQFSGVTYLDAGPTISLSLGTRTDELPRNSAGGITTYNLATGSTLPYRPGDSAVVKVAGVNGGFPAIELRAKTSEAFTFQTPTPVATGYMQLRWTPATDGQSAMILQLTYAPAGGSGNISREIRCAFRDDGIDSIPRAAFAQWADTTNLKREFVATRLRTVLQNISGGGVQFTSLYQIPTPRS
jgi:hypothetical protein